MTNRRTLVGLLGAGTVAMALGAFAQPVGRIRKIGIINALPREAPLPQIFLRGLRDLGYVEGTNVIIEYRTGAFADFPALAEELVGLKVDVIYAVLEQAALAASKATTTIPIVFAVLGDPVRAGLVASLAHPGGNVTGITAFGAALGGKRVELLKELIPRLSRIGVLSSSVGQTPIEDAGRALGVQVQWFPVLRASDINAALEAATQSRIGGLIVEEDSLTFTERGRIIDYAAAHDLPAIYGYRDYVISGGLLSYGAKLPELMHRLLAYIDMILKGARPGDLPVEQPTKFELVINSKTAKTLGLAIPQSLLLRADEVIG